MTTHSLRHITAAATGPETDKDRVTSIRKREHDLHAIKCLGPEQMRLETPVGRNVLQVWDRAVIDLPLEAKGKAQNSISFILRFKDRMVVTKPTEGSFDVNDPVNAGIESDILVSSGNGSPI